MASTDTEQPSSLNHHQREAQGDDGKPLHEVDYTSQPMQRSELDIADRAIHRRRSGDLTGSQWNPTERNKPGFAEFIPNVSPVYISQNGYSDLPELTSAPQSQPSFLPIPQSVEKSSQYPSRPGSFSTIQTLLLASGLVTGRRQEHLTELMNGRSSANSTQDKKLVLRLLSWLRYSFNAILLLVLLLVILVSLASTGHIFHSAPKTQSPSTSLTTVPNISNVTASNLTAPEPKIIEGSPLITTSFYGNSHDQNIGVGSMTSALFMFYQAIDGHVRDIVSDGDPRWWQTSNDIFSDAINNTGLAVTSYLNNSAHQLSIFYISSTSQLQEKRLYDDGTYVWQPAASLINKFITIDGTNAFLWPNETSNGFDSFRIAAIYSSSSVEEPQTHLFYHYSSGSDSFAQELIWTQSNDTWSYGAKFSDVVSSSHFAAVLDGSFLRFYYVSRGPVLRESILNMTQPGAKWQDGQSYPDLLLHHNSDFAVISTPNGTNLYFYNSSTTSTSSSTEEPPISIYELALPPIGSRIAAEPSSAIVVATPALLVAGAGASKNRTVSAYYAPVSATASNTTITVCYAAGARDVQGGYGELQCVSRDMDGVWGSSVYGNTTGQVELPI